MKKPLYLILILIITSCVNKNKMTQEEYLESGKYIWQNFVPKSGQAEFVQGELLRAIEKLRDEAHRNGNGNFNEKCHGILVEYLRKKLNDKEIFDKKEIEQINIDLDRLNIEDQPYTDDDIYDRIDDRIVDWYLYYGDEIKHENNSELYCDENKNAKIIFKIIALTNIGFLKINFI